MKREVLFMDISVLKLKLNEVDTDLLVIPVFEDKKCELDNIKEFYDYAKENLDFSGKYLEITTLPTFEKLKTKMILFVGLGKKSEFDLNKLRIVASKVCQNAANKKGINSISFHATDLDMDLIVASQNISEGAIIGTYKFDKYKSDKKENEKITKLYIIVPEENINVKSINEAILIASAVNNARNLINEPAEVITPSALANLALNINGLETKVYNAAQCKDMGMGAFLAVGQGSRHEPQFIHMRYIPQTEKKATIAIVGKGITFDSGGLDIKPPASMLDMKGDMAGAATVLSIMELLPAIMPQIEVHGIIAACENMPDAASYKPGDVLVAMNGKTIEVDNTDAEGRLTLADALCFAENLNPDVIIDIATLTGACCVALGKIASGLLGNNEDLLKNLKTKASEVGEYLWEMPMFEEYFDDLKSDIADFKNAGSRYGGTSAAALFLNKFVKNTPWAHIDIAGTSILNKPLREYSKGPTGVGVRTILNYIKNF